MNDDDLLRKWCKEQDIDYTLARDLKKKYYPLLEEAHKRFGDAFDKYFYEHRRGTDIRLDNIKTLILLVEKLGVIRKKLSLKEQAVIFLSLQYLPIVEGAFSPEINFLILTLIVNGHDFYWSGEKVNSLTTIEKASLSEKIKFIEKHGFEIITAKCDPKLRHSIAHLFYKIKDNGEIYVQGVKKDISLIHRNLRDISFTMNLIRKLYYRRFAKI